MIISKKFIFVATFALAIWAWLTPIANAQTAAADFPPDVMAVLSRRGACSEWSQKASDPERKTYLDDIKDILRSLKCDEVADDEKVLRQKYAGNPDILRALDATWVRVVKRLPVPAAPKSPPPDSSR
jgi:hypothetical protein